MDEPKQTWQDMLYMVVDKARAFVEAFDQDMNVDGTLGDLAKSIVDLQDFLEGGEAKDDGDGND